MRGHMRYILTIVDKNKYGTVDYPDGLTYYIAPLEQLKRTARRLELARPDGPLFWIRPEAEVVEKNWLRYHTSHFYMKGDEIPF